MRNFRNRQPPGRTRSTQGARRAYRRAGKPPGSGDTGSERAWCDSRRSPHYLVEVMQYIVQGVSRYLGDDVLTPAGLDQNLLVDIFNTLDQSQPLLTRQMGINGTNRTSKNTVDGDS